MFLYSDRDELATLITKLEESTPGGTKTKEEEKEKEENGDDSSSTKSEKSELSGE